MTQEQFDELLRSQQGDFNAVLMYDGYVITDQKTTNSVNTIIMLLCSCRKMCTFAAKIAQNRFSPKYQTIVGSNALWMVFHI